MKNGCEGNFPLISIITICKNAELYIEDTIKSVLSQTYPQKEYIIIDGGSSDKTLDIVRKYEKAITCIVSELDAGISDAFNKGIAKSTGDLIGIINAGDLFYDEDSLLKIAQVYSDGCEIIQGRQILRNFETGFEYVLRPSTEYGHLYNLVRFYPNHMSTYIAKSVFEKYGCYKTDFQICMDVELLYRLHRRGVVATQIEQVIGVFRLGGLSENHELIQAREKIKILKEDNGNCIEVLLCIILLISKIIVRRVAKVTCGIDAIRTKGCRRVVGTSI